MAYPLSVRVLAASALLVLPLSLPAQHLTRAADHRRATLTVAAPACAPDNAGLTLPPGFCAMIVADSLAQPRHPLVMPNGDVFIASARVGIIALRDTTGDGHPDVVQRWGGFGGSEVRIRNGYLYGETKTAIIRFPIAAGSLTPSGSADTIVSGLPTRGHAFKTFVIGNDNTLYVNIGSLTNVCQPSGQGREAPGIDPCTERDTRAGIWAFRADKIGQTQSDGVHYATGIRNAVGMAIDPRDGSLWTTQHGRDQLSTNWPKLYDDAKSAETPAEELFHIAKGDDFGWPYCYYDWQIARKVLAPEYGGDGKSSGRCASLKSNVAAFPGHWAPNALVFSASSSFPERYREGVFIAFHGSWNRAPLPQAGYNVVFQPLRNGRASGPYEVFADGFAPKNGATGVTHRPTGLAFGPDGSLYVADDAAGRLYRIMYTGTTR
jgi:glucose/arabinose dehydrogenase